jgi:hypothetical protein
MSTKIVLITGNNLIHVIAIVVNTIKTSLVKMLEVRNISKSNILTRELIFLISRNTEAHNYHTQTLVHYLLNNRGGHVITF